MKPAVFAILALCATAVYADGYDFEYSNEFDSFDENELIPNPRTLIGENIKHAANKFVQKSMAEFHKIEAKFVQVADKIREGAQSVAKGTKEEVKETVDAVEKKVKQIITKGEHFFHCIKLNFPEFKDLTKTTVSNLKSCAKNLSDVITGFKKAAGGHAASLVKTLGELVAIVGECTAEGAVLAAKCALKHMKDAEVLVVNTISDFKVLVHAIQEQYGPLMEDLKVCKNENLSAISQQFKEVEEKMLECTRNQ